MTGTVGFFKDGKVLVENIFMFIPYSLMQSDRSIFWFNDVVQFFSAYQLAQTITYTKFLTIDKFYKTEIRMIRGLSNVD